MANTWKKKKITQWPFRGLNHLLQSCDLSYSPQCFSSKGSEHRKSEASTLLKELDVLPKCQRNK